MEITVALWRPRVGRSRKKKNLKFFVRQFMIFSINYFVHIVSLYYFIFIKNRFLLRFFNKIILSQTFSGVVVIKSETCFAVKDIAQTFNVKSEKFL